MTMLTLATAHRTHPSADVTVPDDVVDVLLWRTAFDVAAEHQRGPTGDCTNLRCASEHGTCTPARQALHALRIARRAPAPTPQPTRNTPHTTPPSPGPSRPQPPIAGRATVARPNTTRFTGWFTSTARAVSTLRLYHLPRRQPGAALAYATGGMATT
ncbi:hypothetical protein GCM10009827_015840 [Dactylosporangium maewongense]|uniref:Uncharacterized protein n=1 Tax=Dactylosporangium maewongense TaxID=634393 RepID=A0ABN1ZSK0_9ACTN